MRLPRLALLLILVPFAGCSRRTEEEPFLVGHVAPFSGRDRLIGEHTQRGMRLALAEANQTPIAGRLVAVVHADSRSDPAVARAELVRLATLNKVLAVLGGEPDDVERLVAAGGPYSLPLLTAAIPRSSASQEGVFSLDVTTDFRGEVLARFADKELKANRAVVLVDESRPVCAAVSTAFAQKWRGGDKKTVQSHSLDLKAEGSKVVGLLGEAQVVVFAGTAKDFARARAALEKERKTPKFIFAGEAAEWARLAADLEAGRDVYAANVYAPPGLSKDGKRFVARYRKQFEEGSDLYAFEGYELASVIVEALRETRGVGGAKLREELAKEREFPGLTGTVRFKQGHAVRPLYVLRRGEEEQAKEYKPASP
jgi:branched-chain amino acid transport system substrate-binding protein